jgi:uncharacterized membrane protein (DUF2068 family)
VTFAGVLFLLVAAFNVVDGLVLLEKPEKLFVGEDAVVVTNYDAFGITLLVVAGLQFIVGWGILNLSRWAQVTGIVLAAASFIIQLAMFRHYPAWAVTIMALDTIVIYGLTVHGDEFGRRRSR